MVCDSFPDAIPPGKDKNEEEMSQSLLSQP